MANRDEALGELLKPFVTLRGHKKGGRWGPLAVTGLIAPGERKSTHPFAATLDPASVSPMKRPSAPMTKASGRRRRKKPG